VAGRPRGLQARSASMRNKAIQQQLQVPNRGHSRRKGRAGPIGRGGNVAQQASGGIGQQAPGARGLERAAAGSCLVWSCWQRTSGGQGAKRPIHLRLTPRQGRAAVEAAAYSRRCSIVFGQQDRRSSPLGEEVSQMKSGKQLRRADRRLNGPADFFWTRRVCSGVCAAG